MVARPRVTQATVGTCRAVRGAVAPCMARRIDGWRLWALRRRAQFGKKVGVQATAPGEPRVTPADLWLNDGLHPSRELVWGARHEPTCGPGRANAGHGWCDTWGVTGPLFRSVSTDSCRRVADR